MSTAVGDPEQQLRTVITALTGRAGVIQELRAEIPRAAMPGVWAFSCRVSDTTKIANSSPRASWVRGRGRGLDRTDAILHAVSEGLEGYANGIAGAGSRLVFGSAKECADAFGEVIAPSRFTRMSDEEREAVFPGSRHADDNSALGWYPAEAVDGSGRALVPAQLVFGGYALRPAEPTVQATTSKGVGVYWDDAGCILHGIDELLEADGCMRAFLLREPVPEVDLTVVDDPVVARLRAALDETDGSFLRAWALPSEGPARTILVCLGQELHGAPLLTFGCAYGIDEVASFTQAAFEAIDTTCFMSADRVAWGRTWTEREFSAVRGQAEHKLLGANAAYIEGLSWLLDSQPTTELRRGETRTKAEALEAMVRACAESGITFYASSLPMPDVTAATGLRAWRVICPQLRPFALAPVWYLGESPAPIVPPAVLVPHPCP